MRKYGFNYKKRIRRKYKSNSIIKQTLLIIMLLSLISNFCISRLYLIREPIAIKSYDLEAIANFHIHNDVLVAIEDYAIEEEKDFYDVLVNTMIHYDFSALDEDIIDLNKVKKVKQNNEYEALVGLYQMILEDIRFFPIAYNLNSQYEEYYYGDTWLASRSYGGERLHYGTDIMDSNNTRGYLPIVSMTDGVVENIGWLEKGGYRIGVRAPSGAYFYYAHLYTYTGDINQGDTIKAGELLGFMGDSGYGEEGTIGMFDVHLHMGISVPLKHQSEEYWVNPYWILRYIEDNKINFWY
ncbi:M23 family metallopeptidase [Natranaerovirga hydrolytica]|uniref:M23 family metallopeptidase n=1 Tax=Natranaerovirga hydrolytica TaxID=680378 RepID=UPI001FA9CCD5|nr:M23 family metallopeptidase [Natranaerovirga hydrolytica]